MKFHKQYLTIVSVFFSINSVNIISGLDLYNNCSSSYYDGDRPIASAPVGGSSLQNLSDPRTISLMEMDQENRLDHLRRTFSCYYHKPIQWITTNQMVPFKLKWNYFKREKEEAEGIKSQRFISEFVFIFRKDDLHSPIFFSCQPVHLNDPCERSFIEIQPGKHYPSFNAISSLTSKHLTDTLNETNERLLELDGPVIGNLSWNDCKLQLIVKQIKGHLLEYKWVETFGNKIEIEKVIATNSSIYFENLFRHSIQERNCVKVLKPNETCENCKKVTNDVVNAIVFYAKAGRMEITLKGLFNIAVNGSRKFYMEWEVPTLEMIYLQELPSTLYVNRTYFLSCNVSTFYFSLGTFLTVGSRKTLEKETTEIYREYGNIEARADFTFRKGGIRETINCFAPLIKSMHVIYKSRTVFIDYPEAPVINGSSKTIRITEDFKSINGSIFCEAYGKPLPTLTWHFPDPEMGRLVIQRDNQTLDGEVEIVRSEIIFPTFTTNFKGIYKCVASNYLSSVSHSISIQLLQPSSDFAISKKLKMGIGLSLAILVMIFLGVIFLLIRQVGNQKLRYKQETDIVENEFINGVGNSGKGSLDPLQFPILSRPYNRDYDVPTNKWEIEDGILGEGEFGIVRKGTVELNSERQPVAIKMLKPSADLDEFKGFLLEIKVMEYVGRHPNVISLLACSTDNFANRDVLIGVEYCPNGSLRTYITERKGIFQKREDVKDRNSAFGAYANFTYSSLTELDLYIWACQIARGMEFLASRNVLHGDLAIRNILLKADKVAKISDFGLSRFLNEQGNYIKKAVRVPWKIMPPESLKDRHFSTASDVWGYGVTLWELFSLGEVPYAGIGYSSKFLKQLENGMRLGKPTRAPQNIYLVMLQCWDPNPAERPHFSALKLAFSKILDTLNSPSKDSQILPKNLLNTNDFTLRIRSRSPSMSRSPTRSKVNSKTDSTTIQDPGQEGHCKNIYINK